MSISKPLLEFPAAARTTHLLNLPHRVHRAIDILDDKACLPSTRISGTEPHGINRQ